MKVTQFLIIFMVQKKKVTQFTNGFTLKYTKLSIVNC